MEKHQETRKEEKVKKQGTREDYERRWKIGDKKKLRKERKDEKIKGKGVLENED